MQSEAHDQHRRARGDPLLQGTCKGKGGAQAAVWGVRVKVLDVCIQTY